MRELNGYSAGEEISLEAALAQILQKYRLKVFISMVSHELKIPVTALKAYINL
ncbi:hypothetical protein [Pedobacter kyonggii]|uniref:hypothetical protein n=1 Tax=Pedobacter kyonggii TaxID=1926871 RepID=UPI001ABFA122|nr:hypothetical protein [Pedobacter kyonggii]